MESAFFLELRLEEKLKKLQDLFERGEYLEALTNASEIKQYFQKSPEFWAFIGACEHQIGKAQQAEDSLRFSLSLDPNNFDANNNLGAVFIDLKNYEQAEIYFKKAIKINPLSADASYNLGKVYRANDNTSKAKALFKEAIKLRPTFSFAYNNLGNCQKREGDLEQAIHSYRAAIRCNTNFRLPKWNLSLALIRNENFKEGYENYHYGFDLTGTDEGKERGKYIGNPQLEWRGEVDTTHLIIWGEQGIGDELMFANFIKYIPESIANIEVRVQKKMINIIREKLRCDPRITVSQRDDEMGVTPHIPIGNLPALYWNDFEQDQEDKIRKFLFPQIDFEKNLTIGINWRGGNNPEARKRRSLTIESFKSLSILDNSNCCIVPLQYDSTVEELNQLEVAFGDRLHTLNYDAREDVDAWAADIQSCDLLVTVDNSAVHIAAEYRIPVIVLLPTDSDFRWGSKANSTVFYESVRLIRNSDNLSIDLINAEITNIMKEMSTTQKTEETKSGGPSLLGLEDFSRKGQELVKLYSEMASEGYSTVNGDKVTSAYNDMEIRKYSVPVLSLLKSCDVNSLLDYGCGGSDYEAPDFANGVSAKEYFDLEAVSLYEPARGIDQRKISDAVVCFDVLEHLFVSDVPRVLREIFSLATKIVILNVAAYNARAIMPNGENAHITVRDKFWWKGMVDSVAIEYPEVKVQLWVCPAYLKAEAFDPYKAADWLMQDSFVTN